jgi:hypothetical protein
MHMIRDARLYTAYWAVTCSCGTPLAASRDVPVRVLLQRHHAARAVRRPVACVRRGVVRSRPRARTGSSLPASHLSELRP